MIRSMTGYGTETLMKEGKSLTVEIRSLNHRYCEINIRLPKKLFFLENAIKNQIKNSLIRGKIDVYINYQNADGSDVKVTYNKNLAQNYLEELQKMSAELYLENDLSVSKFLKLPDLFISQEEEEDENFLKAFISEAVELALHKIDKARELEGELLKTDIIEKLSDIEKMTLLLPNLEKQSVEQYQKKLEEKLTEILRNESIDQSRIITEVALLADKISIDEEIVRLQGHLVHMQDVLQEGEAIGKKLDFIVQEMNREANTIASKAINMEIKGIAIELKNCIEKIREQIQNIE